MSKLRAVVVAVILVLGTASVVVTTIPVSLADHHTERKEP
jgi:hypothetical protein